jgi:hypothetical protein
VFYLHDVILYGETLQELNARLRDVFEKLRQFNLKIDPDVNF